MFHTGRGFWHYFKTFKMVSIITPFYQIQLQKQRIVVLKKPVIILFCHSPIDGDRIRDNPIRGKQRCHLNSIIDCRSLIVR